MAQNSILKNVQCLDPLKLLSNEQLLTLSAENEIENVISENEQLKVEKRGKNVYLNVGKVNVRSDSFFQIDKIGDVFVFLHPRKCSR